MVKIQNKEMNVRLVSHKAVETDFRYFIADLKARKIVAGFETHTEAVHAADEVFDDTRYILMDLSAAVEAQTRWICGREV